MKGKVSLYGQQLIHCLGLNKEQMIAHWKSGPRFIRVLVSDRVQSAKLEFSCVLGKFYCKHNVQMVGVTDAWWVSHFERTQVMTSPKLMWLMMGFSNPSSPPSNQSTV